MKLRKPEIITLVITAMVFTCIIGALMTYHTDNNERPQQDYIQVIGMGDYRELIWVCEDYPDLKDSINNAFIDSTLQTADQSQLHDIINEAHQRRRDSLRNRLRTLLTNPETKTLK